ncbi:MAG: Xaa-Pro peptidase family protein [Salinisphaera sp.]|nr:Xaa-Pro peptidase family protein [Salinisphaera sp.]
MKDKAAGRLQSLREKMATDNIDLLVLGPDSHMRWLLGFAPHADERPCVLFVSAASSAFLMPGLNAEDVAAQTDITLHRWGDGDGPSEALKSALYSFGARSPARIAIDETLRADHALLVLEMLPGVDYCYASSVVGALRLKKDSDERHGLTASARVNDGAMQAAFVAVRPGTTEREIAAVVQGYYLDHGAKPGFDIIGSGPNGAYPHHASGNRTIQAGDAIVIDIGGIYQGYPSDMTRMAFVGEPPEDYRQVHAIVDDALQAALAAARPGVKAKTVDAAARRIIEASGYGEYFTTRTGHGLGLDIHEAPYLSPTSETILEPGMVFSIEPGIYMPDRYGVRLEEIVYLTETGPDIFSRLPRDVHQGKA